MTGEQIIAQAKLIYPVETFISLNFLVDFINLARERVNRLQKLFYAEFNFNTTAGVNRYQMSKKFYEVYRSEVVVGGVVKELRKGLEGQFPLKETYRSYPLFYVFTPMDKMVLYPVPDTTYMVAVHGYTPLDFNYTVTNLTQPDVLPDQYIDPIAIDVAKRIASYDQQYELAGALENEFMNQLKQIKS